MENVATGVSLTAFIESDAVINAYVSANGQTDKQSRDYFNDRACGESGLKFGYADANVPASLFAGFGGLLIIPAVVLGVQGEYLTAFVCSLVPLVLLGAAGALFSLSEPEIKTPQKDAKKALRAAAQEFHETGKYRPY